jgi:aminomethyltransferase
LDSGYNHHFYSPAKFLLIVNAGNVAKDAAWMESQLVSRKVTFADATEQMGLLALQGPSSQALLEKAYPDLKLSGLHYYQFLPWKSGVIARTGYTGEDGFEIMADLKELSEIWDRLFASGKEFGLVPAGFGSRDTLRLEAGMPLYGHDLSEEMTPLEAGLGWSVDLSKNDFIGKEALRSQKENGLKKKLVGFEMIDRGIPRQDYEITKNGIKIGKVTSGSFAPTLEKNIGMGYVRAEEAQAGNEIQITIRGNALKAKVVKLPFYKRKA